MRDTPKCWRTLWLGQRSIHPEPSTLMLVMSDVSRDFLDVVDVLTTKKNYRFISVLPDPPSPPPRPMMLLIVPNDILGSSG